jgi:hypothetical protein
VPKQRTNDPNHHVTSASMLAVSRSSGDRSMRHRAKPANRRETHSRLRPRPSAHNDFLDSDGDDSDNDDSAGDGGNEERHASPDSSQIRAATAGRMSRRCVYSPSAVANQSVSRKGCHAMIAEMAHRKRNVALGARLIIASRSDESTRDHTRNLSATHSMRKKNRPPQKAVAGGQGFGGWGQNAAVTACLLLHSDF